MDPSFLNPPSIVESVERAAWLEVFSFASDKFRTLALESSNVEGVPLIGSRALAITEFNRAFVLEDAEHPELDVLIAWLDGNAAYRWALQIAYSVHTRDVRAAAEELELTPMGPGWSKFLAHAGSVPMPGTEHRIEVVEDGTDFGDIVGGVYGLPGAGADLFASLASRPGWTVCVASVDGSIAGAGAMYVEGEWAWFGIDATLPGFRGKGVQTALIRFRAQRARALGVRYLTAETGRPERPGGKHTSGDNYRRSGFTEIYHRMNFGRSE